MIRLPSFPKLYLNAEGVDTETDEVGLPIVPTYGNQLAVDLPRIHSHVEDQLWMRTRTRLDILPSFKSSTIRKPFEAGTRKGKESTTNARKSVNAYVRCPRFTKVGQKLFRGRKHKHKHKELLRFAGEHDFLNREKRSLGSSSWNSPTTSSDWPAWSNDNYDDSSSSSDHRSECSYSSEDAYCEESLRAALKPPFGKNLLGENKRRSH